VEKDRLSPGDESAITTEISAASEKRDTATVDATPNVGLALFESFNNE
jgi:hypothetical protein